MVRNEQYSEHPSTKLVWYSDVQVLFRLLSRNKFVLKLSRFRTFLTSLDSLEYKAVKAIFVSEIWIAEYPDFRHPLDIKTTMDKKVTC